MKVTRMVIVGFSVLFAVKVIASEPYSVAQGVAADKNHAGAQQIRRSNEPVIGGLSEDPQEVPERYRETESDRQEKAKQQEVVKQKDEIPESGW